MADLKKIAFLPDAHRPYHNKKSWDLFLNAMDWWGPDVLVCLGDLADCYKLSSFSKDPRRTLTFDEEVDDVREAVMELEQLASELIFVEGNHEHRIQRYLRDKAPELFGLISTRELFGLEAWVFVPYKDSTRLGKLWITHDCGTAGRYSAFRTADTFQHPVVTAHTHRLIYLVEGNATGEYFPSVQFGWLGDVEQVDYMHRVVARRAWCQAFGTGLLDTDTGFVYLTPHPIIEGSVVVDGKRFG